MPRPLNRTATVVRVLLIVAGVAVLTLLLRTYGLYAWVLKAYTGIAAWGPPGFLIFIGVYAMAAVLLVPGSILAIGAGALFGLGAGALLAIVGAVLGAIGAFLVGRHLVRDRIAHAFAGNSKFTLIDHAVAREGWKMVLLIRLSPLFPYNLVNYAFGLTRIRFKPYAWASLLGVLPGTIMNVYIGSLAIDLAEWGYGARSHTTGEWILYGIGFMATVAVAVLVTRTARQALAQRLPD